MLVKLLDVEQEDASRSPEGCRRTSCQARSARTRSTCTGRVTARRRVRVKRGRDELGLVLVVVDEQHLERRPDPEGEEPLVVRRNGSGVPLSLILP